MRFALRNKDKLVNAFGIEAHQLLLDSLKDYARNHEDVSVSAPYHSTVNKDALAVCKALQEIAGNYKISIHTRIINTAVKVIGIKIDNMNFNCD